MGSYIIQTPDNLYSLSRDGAETTAIAPPVGTTVISETNRLYRIALLAKDKSAVVVFVNGATKDFYQLADGSVYPLQLSAPANAPTVTGGTGVGLTGVYQIAVSFKIKSVNGALIQESPLSQVVTAATIAGKTLALSNMPTSPDPFVNSRGVYRSTAGGTLLYPWFDLDGNTIKATDRGGPDALLSLLPASIGANGTPPDLSHICAWRDRLWAIPRLQPDNLRWSEERLFYAWPAVNEAILPPQNVNSDESPLFVPRRDALGIAHKGHFFQIIGNSNTNFQRQTLSETIGGASQESVVVAGNNGYFLGTQSGRFVVFEWSDEGLRPISEAQVDAWFNTDTYFARLQFSRAQGRYNPNTDAYELLVCAAGSTALDRWVSFSLRSRQWYGPHKTDAFTPTCAGRDPIGYSGTLTDEDGLPCSVLGASDGRIYRRASAQQDDNGTAVDFNVDLPTITGGDPDFEKVWGQPTIYSHIETTGALAITPAVGGVGATTGAVISHSLTTGREVLRRLGRGRLAQLNLRQTGATQSVAVYAIDLPFVLTGKR